MPRLAIARRLTRKTRQPRKLRARPTPPGLRVRGVLRWLARFRRAPRFVQFMAGIAVVAVLIPAGNWIYQVIRKPSELFFPVSARLFKSPAETWRAYAPIFRTHSTTVMTPFLLAALAQVEASGNPVARTYWQWSANPAPLKIYRPASSAVGMYQIIDGTFEEARRYCIHDHRVVADGPWHAWRSCWFNSLYMRVIPSHAVELTAANLDRTVRAIRSRGRLKSASLRQQQDLAILVHLCGAGGGAVFAARGLQVSAGQRCGSHAVRAYLARVQGMAQEFARLAARD